MFRSEINIFRRDYRLRIKNDIEFVREPMDAEYGTVAVFKDLYGNLWDLLQLNEKHPQKAENS